MVPRADRAELTAIFAGGFVGAVLRYGLAESLPAEPGAWPWATLVENVVGTAMLGYFATRLSGTPATSACRRPFLATGLCGALTTFSTLQLELLRMLDRSEYGLAGTYVVASLAAGFAVVFVATKLVRRVRPRG